MIIIQGQLCLWREDSLKEKYNIKYFKINFAVYASKFWWTQAYNFAILLCLRPHISAGTNIKDALLQNLMIMVSYSMLNFLQLKKLITHI